MTYEKKTLKEIKEKISAFESLIAESEEDTDNIERLSQEILAIALNRNNKAEGNTVNVNIYSDYDADGICSAYIMKAVLETIKTSYHVKVNVFINDPRNGYGVPSDFQCPEQSNGNNIVLDMGCNQLNFLKTVLGKDVIIIDHHLIKDENIKREFRESEFLLNPHCRIHADGKSTDYCATGLCDRICHTLNERGMLNMSEKKSNAVRVMACLGTLADMVNVIDPHSYNRFIIKDGMEALNNATPDNLDFLIGYMIDQNTNIKLSDCTSKDLAFFTAYLNCGKRMSGVMERNISQEIFDTVSGEETKENCNRLDVIGQINAKRKEMISKYKTDKKADFPYAMFVKEEINNPDSNVCVFVMPKNAPSQFCGVIAGDLCSEVNKAAIVLTYNEKEGYYTGSARNAEGRSSLYKFLQEIVEKPEAHDLKIEFGGHDNAFGISSLNNADLLIKLVAQYNDLLKSTSSVTEILDMSIDELQSPQTIKQIRELEPFGKDFKLPRCVISGNLVKKEPISGKSNWQRLTIADRDSGTSFEVIDWAFNINKIPKTSDNSFIALADVGINLYKEEKIQLEPVFLRAFKDDVEKGMFVEENLQVGR